MSSTVQGTTLPVQTTADQFPVFVIGMGESPRSREKTVPGTGEVTYASGTVLRMARKDGNLQADKAASVNVINPAATYALGEIYKAQGRVYVMPFENNGRMTLSITVEQLVPVDAATPAPTNGRAKDSAAA